MVGTVAGAVAGGELEKGLFPTLPYDPTLVGRGAGTAAQIFGEGLGYLGAPYLLARKPFDIGAQHLMQVWGTSSSKVLRGTAKGTDVLQGFLRGAGEMTAKRPFAAAVAEVASMAESATYGGASEQALPGNMGARFTAEVVGSFSLPIPVNRKRRIICHRRH